MRVKKEKENVTSGAPCAWKSAASLLKIALSSRKSLSPFVLLTGGWAGFVSVPFSDLIAASLLRPVRAVALLSRRLIFDRECLLGLLGCFCHAFYLEATYLHREDLRKGHFLWFLLLLLILN